MVITAETMLVRAGHAAETTIGEEVVLMTIETGECLGLSETGSDIWRLLEVRTSFAALIDELMEIYDGTREEMERGAKGFVGDLVGRGLIIAG